jgi:hypothetical protein
MEVKVNSGFLNGIPRSKMLMKITVPAGVTKLDYGTLVFNPTDQKDRLPSRVNDVVINRGTFPVVDWVQYAVGIVSDADGLEIKGGMATVPTGFSIEVNNYKQFLDDELKNNPSSTALLPFQSGGTGSGIPLSDLPKLVADVTTATGVNHYTNAIQ